MASYCSLKKIGAASLRTLFTDCEEWWFWEDIVVDNDLIFVQQSESLDAIPELVGQSEEERWMWRRP